MAIEDEVCALIECPECGEEAELSVARINRERQHTCVACGVVVHFPGGAGSLEDLVDQIRYKRRTGRAR